MKKFNLKDFFKGWFCGNFSPTIIKTNDYEVAIKKYKKGEYEISHCHMLADEITVIISGEVKMNKIIYKENDIILIEKNEYTDFECLTDVITCVVKTGSYDNDKYIK